MKKLIEMYGLKEGPFDSINKQLGSTKSVARDPRAPQQKARVGQSGAVQKAQADLDQSKSVFDEAAGKTTALNLTDEELNAIRRWAGEYREDPGAEELLKKIEDAENDGGGGTPFSSSSSSSSSRSVGGLKLQ